MLPKLRRFLTADLMACAALIAALTCASSLGAAEPPAPIPGIPIGWCILAKPDVFADAKSAGFEYVELAMQGVLPLSDEEFQKLAGQMQTLGLHARTGYNVIPKEIALVGPEADQVKQNEHVRQLLERAAVLKLEYLILNAGASWRVPDGFSREQALKQLANFAGRFAIAAERKNITVLVEPVRSTDSNLLTTIAEAVALVEAVQHPNFQMMVDYSFLRIQKDDVNALLKAGSHLRHVHIANPGKTPRTYPMDPSESDYSPFFRILKQIGYRGGISVHAGTQDFATEAPRAIAFLRAWAAEVAGP